MQNSGDHGGQPPAWRFIVATVMGTGGILALVPLFIDRSPPPQVNVTTTIQLPADPMPSGARRAPADQTGGAAATSGKPQQRDAAVDPRPSSAPPSETPGERTRSVLPGELFPLCGTAGFSLSPWVAVPGEPRQATLRASADVPGAPIGARFERVLRIGMAEELWPGCKITLIAIGTGPAAFWSIREHISQTGGKP
ncbi:hypothetical protein V5F44_06385 [Xanthobacter sp. V2C-8]|uniref:hypothetical protein n=1 Tax=Xanthobacter albus TaxID=3119929 RepID=UPI003728DA53